MKKYKVTVKYKDKGEYCIEWKLHSMGRDEVSDNLIFKQRPEDLKEETVSLSFIPQRGNSKSQSPKVKASFVFLPLIQFPSEFSSSTALSS